MRLSEAAGLAREALAEGDSALAGAITERLLAEFGRYPPARLLRALLAEQANDTQAALDDLRAVTSAEPANAEARAAQARLFQHRGDTDRARVAARQALELIPTDPDVLESALEILNVEADALDTSAAILARVHLNCGWPDLAERHARAAVSESPERVDVRLTLAEALWRLGRLPACEAECRVVADQAEECVRAAVMRAHILSERGRTAEGQELLDRIGRIDPEFREARELLGTLEVHRLVLPDAVDFALPSELLGQTNGTAPAGGPQRPSDEAPRAPVAPGVEAPPRAAQPEGREAERPVPPAAHDDPAAPSAQPQDPVSQPAPAAPEPEAPAPTQTDDGLDESGQVRTGAADAPIQSEQPHLEENVPDPRAPDAVTPPANDATSVSPDAAATAVSEPDEPATAAVPELDEPATAAAFSTFDWARHLIERSDWAEAERVLTDIVNASDLDASRVDGLLLEAVAHRELRGATWKLLGDHYMRTGRPQAAADAYLRAANVADQST